MLYNRRKILCYGANTALLASGLIVPTPALAAGNAIPWAANTLPGTTLMGDQLNAAITQLNNQRALISLANDATLKAECERVAAEARKGIKAAVTLRKNYNGQLSDAQITKVISGISFVVGTLTAIAFVFTTSPAWVFLGLGVGTASAAWSLIQFTNSSGTDRAVMGVSHFGGRFSLVGATTTVSAAAKTVGRCLAGLGAAADLYSAVIADGTIDAVKGRLALVESELGSVRQRYVSFSNDLTACRTARLAEIDASIGALTFVRDLGDITLGPAAPVPIPRG